MPAPRVVAFDALPLPRGTRRLSRRRAREYRAKKVAQEAGG
jgi:hypothetical protein